MTEILEAMTAPDVNGTPALPRRSGPKGLLPSTWGGRALRLEYVVGGETRQTTGKLLDTYPSGIIIGSSEAGIAARTLIAWDTVAVVELIPD